MNKKLIASVAIAATGASIVLTTTQAQADTVTVRTADFIPNLSDTRANGHVTVGDNGIGVVTTKPAAGTASPLPDKAAEYWKASIPLSDVDAATLKWVGTQVQPGLQLVVDFDGSATTGSKSMTNDGSQYEGADGILVGEDTAGYGTGADEHFWASGSTTDAVKALAPTDPAGGSAQNGTLAEWQHAFPNATVEAVGFSLGSGANDASGIIQSVSVGDTVYDFAGKDQVVPPPVETAPGNLAKPTGLKVTKTDTSSVTLAWDKVTGAGNYHVFVNGVEAGTTVSNTIKVGNLHFNKAYSFTVAAGQGDSDATGPQSAAVSGKTATVTLAVPTGMTTTGHTSTTVSLKAKNVPNAEGYRWYYGTTSAHLVASGYSDSAEAGYTVQGLKPGTTYYFAVAADSTTTAPTAASARVKVTTSK